MLKPPKKLTHALFRCLSCLKLEKNFQSKFVLEFYDLYNFRWTVCAFLRRKSTVGIVNSD